MSSDAVDNPWFHNVHDVKVCVRPRMDGWRVDVALHIYSFKYPWISPILCTSMDGHLDGWRVDVATHILLPLNIHGSHLRPWMVGRRSLAYTPCLSIHGSHLYYVRPWMEGRRSRAYTPCPSIHGSHLYYVRPWMEGRRSRTYTPCLSIYGCNLYYVRPWSMDGG